METPNLAGSTKYIHGSEVKRNEFTALHLPPGIQVTQKAIRRLKNNKAPGTDRIDADLVKNGVAQLENEILVIEISASSTQYTRRETELELQQLPGYYGVEYHR